MSKLQKLLYRMIGRGLLKEDGDQEKVKVVNVNSGKQYEVLKSTAQAGIDSGKYLDPKDSIKKSTKQSDVEVEPDEISHKEDGSVDINGGKLKEKHPTENIISLDEDEIREKTLDRYKTKYDSRKEQEEAIFNKISKIKQAKFDRNYNLFKQCDFTDQEINKIENSPNIKPLIKTLETLMSCNLPPYIKKNKKDKPQSFLQRLYGTGLLLQDVGNMSKVGAGKLPAQIGEICVNVFSHTPPEMSQKLYGVMKNHPINQKGTQINSWIQSSYQTSLHLRNYVSQTLGKDYQIVQMGGMMQHPTINEDMIGFSDTSADIYTFVRNKNTNKIIALPTSLKKDENYRLKSATLGILNGYQLENTFNNRSFKDGRQGIKQKYNNHPTLSKQKYLLTLCQKLDSGQVDFLNMFKKSGVPISDYKQLIDVYNAVKDLSKQERENIFNDNDQMRKLLGTPFQRYLEKTYYKTMQFLSQIDQDAEEIQKQLYDYSKDYSNQLIRQLISEPKPLLQFIRQKFPMREMCQQGLIQASNAQVVTWEVILQKFNVKNIDEFVQNMRFQQGGDGFLKAVYSFKTSQGMQYIDIFDIRIRQDGIGYSDVKIYPQPTKNFNKLLKQNFNRTNLQKILIELILNELNRSYH